MEAEVAPTPAAVTPGADSSLSANPGTEVVATSIPPVTSGPSTPIVVCSAKVTEVAATPPAVTAGAASSLSASPGTEVDAPPTAAARVKRILDQEMTRRKQAKVVKQSAPAVVATPARSNSTPPEVPVESTAHLLKRKVGREEDVEKVAELLASQPPSDDDAEDATMHYEGSSDFLLAWDEQWSRGFQSSDEEWEEGCDEVEGWPEDDNDGVSLEIQPSDSESLHSVSKAGDGSRDLWIGEEEMARRYGKPEGWESMKAAEYLSPCDQEVPKPRGRKPGKGKGKKRAKKSKASKLGDDDDNDDDDTLKRTAAPEPSGPKSAKKRKSSPAPKAKCSSAPRAKRGPAPKASPKRAPKTKKSPAPKAKPTVKKAVAKSKAISSYRAPCLDDSDYKAKMSRRSLACAASRLP